MKIILQDIDNVSYPFKEKHTEYLLEQDLIRVEDAQKFLESKKPYLLDYILSEKKIGNCPYKITEKMKNKYEHKAKEIKKMLELKELNQASAKNIELESYFFATFDDFFMTNHYLTGTVKEIQELNKTIKKTDPEIQIIGITARAIHVKDNPEEYEILTKQTVQWNIQNNVGLDEIFFENKKIKTYHEIKNMIKYKDKEILCFLEDDPRNIEEFLKEGITCVLIRFDYHEMEDFVKQLKEKYKNKLKLADTPQHANEIIQEIILTNKI